MSKFYTYDAWVTEFQPTKNTITNGIDIHFETYGAEQEFVRTTDPKFVWTEVDGDSGTYIVAGYSRVNRIHYYITTNPWIDEWTEVPTWVYRQCECAEDEQYVEVGYNENCDECDEGMIDIPCDTVVALKEIYGEDAPIVN